MIKHYRELVSDYLDEQAEMLPKIAVRETRTKLTTEKKLPASLYRVDEFHGCVSYMLRAVPDFTAHTDKANDTQRHDDYANDDDRHSHHIPEYSIYQVSKRGTCHKEIQSCANVGEQCSLIGELRSFYRQIFAQYKVLIHASRLFEVKFSHERRKAQRNLIVLCALKSFR